MNRVYLGMPRCGKPTYEAMYSVMQCSAFNGNVTFRSFDSSLLALNFNDLICECLNSSPRFDWFVMLHSDVKAPEGWLDKLIIAGERGGYDLIHSPLAIKSGLGLLSTAVGSAASEWGMKRRLTVRDLQSLPEAFDLGHVKGCLGWNLPTDACLLPNTGCMAMRMGEWVERFVLDRAFTVKDRVVLHQSRYIPLVVPEDWGLGFWCANNGVRVGAVKAGADHVGVGVFSVDRPWGTCTIDPEFDEEGWNGRLEPTARSLGSTVAGPTGEHAVSGAVETR